MYNSGFPRSYGTFVDYNNDGLLDIAATTQYFASSTNETNYIRIFLNDGTRTEPSFKNEFIYLKVGGDILGGSSMSNFMTILFDDLNFDGKRDMICGVGYKEDDNTGFYYALNNSMSGEMELGALKPILFNGTPLQKKCPVAPMGSRACISFEDTDKDNIKELYINKETEYGKGIYEKYILRNNGTDLIALKDAKQKLSNISVLSDKIIFKNCQKGSIIKLYTINGKELYSSHLKNNQTLTVDKKIFPSGIYVYTFKGEGAKVRGIVSFK